MLPKIALTSRSGGWPAVMFEFLQVAKASFLVRSNRQLTSCFFALKTGNVFSRSTCLRWSDCIARDVNSDTACNGCRYASQKISEMLRLARDECEGAILSRGLNSRAEQKRLSTAQAL